MNVAVKVLISPFKEQVDEYIEEKTAHLKGFGKLIEKMYLWACFRHYWNKVGDFKDFGNEIPKRLRKPNYIHELHPLIESNCPRPTIMWNNVPMCVDTINQVIHFEIQR